MSNSLNTDFKFKTSDNKFLSMELKADYNVDSSKVASKKGVSDCGRMTELMLATLLGTAFAGKTFEDLSQELQSKKEGLEINMKRIFNEMADECFFPMRITNITIGALTPRSFS